MAAVPRARAGAAVGGLWNAHAWSWAAAAASPGPAQPPNPPTPRSHPSPPQPPIPPTPIPPPPQPPGAHTDREARIPGAGRQRALPGDGGCRPGAGGKGRRRKRAAQQRADLHLRQPRLRARQGAKALGRGVGVRWGGCTRLPGDFRRGSCARLHATGWSMGRVSRVERFGPGSDGSAAAAMPQCLAPIEAKDQAGHTSSRKHGPVQSSPVQARPPLRPCSPPRCTMSSRSAWRPSFRASKSVTASRPTPRTGPSSTQQVGLRRRLRGGGVGGCGRPHSPLPSARLISAAGLWRRSGASCSLAPSATSGWPPNPWGQPQFLPQPLGA
jgi:hypothetical protein